MVHIILMCLKIIGIIMAAILGVFLLIILLVLLVPVKYKIKAEKYENVKGVLKISWLFHIIYLKGFYANEKFNLKLKIFGITFFNNRRKKREKGKKINKTNKTKENNISTELNLKEEEPDWSGQYYTETISNKEESYDEIQEKTVVDDSDDNQEKNIFRKILDRIEKIIKSIKDFFTNILFKIKNISAKIKSTIKNVLKGIKNINDKIIIIKEFTENSVNRSGFKKIWKSIKDVLKHIRPQKIKAHIKLGTGDVYSTGQVLVFLGIAYPIYGKSVMIIPDFENKIAEGDIFIKGRIRFGTLLWTVIKLFFDKKFRLFVDNLKQLKEEL